MAVEMVRLNVQGMSCEHCACRVERALEELEGVAGVQVDLQAQTATVAMGERKPSPEEMIAAVEAVGYTASVAE